VYQYSHDQASRVIMVLFIGMLLGAPLAGYLSERLNSRKFVLALSCISAAILISLLLYNPHWGPKVVYSVLFLYALFSGAISLNFVIARELTQDSTSATAMAFTNMMTMLGCVIFLPILSLFLKVGFRGEIIHGALIYPVSDYQMALTIMPIALFTAGILAIFLKETYQFKD